MTCEVFHPWELENCLHCIRIQEFWLKNLPIGLYYAKKKLKKKVATSHQLWNLHKFLPVQFNTQATSNLWRHSRMIWESLLNRIWACPFLYLKGCPVRAITHTHTLFSGTYMHARYSLFSLFAKIFELLINQVLINHLVNVQFHSDQEYDIGNPILRVNIETNNKKRKFIHN